MVKKTTQEKALFKAFLVQVFLPLALGVIIYALIRKNPPFAQYLPWEKPLIDIRFLPGFLYDIIQYHLSDMLWTLSFVNALYLVFAKRFLPAVIVFTVTVLYELSKYFGLAAGTFDILDILYSLAVLLIYLLLKREDKHKN